MFQAFWKENKKTNWSTDQDKFTKKIIFLKFLKINEPAQKYPLFVRINEQ